MTLSNPAPAPLPLLRTPRAQSAIESIHNLCTSWPVLHPYDAAIIPNPQPSPPCSHPLPRCLPPAVCPDAGATRKTHRRNPRHPDHRDAGSSRCRSQTAAPAAEVSYSNGQITVAANNSSLNQILRDISSKTGMKITGGVTDERVFGQYGPAVPSSILTTLLDGTSSNMLLVSHRDIIPLPPSSSLRRATVVPLRLTQCCRRRTTRTGGTRKGA